MKTHIFSLMLSAAIFTTNPLFGMEAEDYPEKIRITSTKILIENPIEVYKRENADLFQDLREEYTVPVFMLQHFMEQNGRVLYQDELARYKFSIGKRSFVLSHGYHSNPREHPLKHVCFYSSVHFSHIDGEPYGKTAFAGKRSVFPLLDKELQDLHGQEHEKCLSQFNFLKATPLVIVEEKDWVEPKY